MVEEKEGDFRREGRKEGIVFERWEDTVLMLNELSETSSRGVEDEE